MNPANILGNPNIIPTPNGQYTLTAGADRSDPNSWVFSPNEAYIGQWRDQQYQNWLNDSRRLEFAEQQDRMREIWQANNEGQTVINDPDYLGAIDRVMPQSLQSPDYSPPSPMGNDIQAGIAAGLPLTPMIYDTSTDWLHQLAPVLFAVATGGLLGPVVGGIMGATAGAASAGQKSNNPLDIALGGAMNAAAGVGAGYGSESLFGAGAVDTAGSPLIGGSNFLSQGADALTPALLEGGGELGTLGLGSGPGGMAMSLLNGNNSFLAPEIANTAGTSGVLPTMGGYAPPAATVASSGGSWIPGISNGQLLLGGAGTLASLGGSIMSNNAQQDAANAAANAAQAGATTAANAQLTGTREAIAAQDRIYNQNRADFAPFLNVAPQALDAYQALTYGSSYIPKNLSNPAPGASSMPKSPMSSSQVANLFGLDENKMLPDQKSLGLSGYPSQSPMSSSQVAYPTFDLANFTPQGTAAYEWQKSRGLEDLGRSLRLMGRPSGTVAANSTARFLGDLNATEYDKGYTRLEGQKQDYTNNLLNLIKTAQGAAGSTSASGQNYANNVSNANITQGTNLANIATQSGINQANANLVKGQSQANLYGGLAQLPFNIANTAINAGWKPFS